MSPSLPSSITSLPPSLSPYHHSLPSFLPFLPSLSSSLPPFPPFPLFLPPFLPSLPSLPPSLPSFPTLPPSLPYLPTLPYPIPYPPSFLFQLADRFRLWKDCLSQVMKEKFKEEISRQTYIGDDSRNDTEETPTTLLDSRTKA